MSDGMMTLEELHRSVQAQRKSLSNLASLVDIGDAMSKEGWDVAFQLSGVTGASIHVAFEGPREDASSVFQRAVEDVGRCLPEALGAFARAVVEQRGPEIVDLPAAPVADGGEAEEAAPVSAVEAIPVDAKDYRTGAYTDGELEKLRQLYGAGKTVPEIANVLGRRNQSVGAKIKYMIANGQLVEREAAPAPAPASVVSEAKPDLSPIAAKCFGHVRGLRPDPAFDPATEAAMCKALLDGQLQNMVAADLGVDGKAMMKRFRLICGPVIGMGKEMTDAMIEALQYRADVAKSGGVA
ncbi:hypothetical protein RPE78_12245 [Thioclava litoralis]|uniref:GcrA cell cycle regulator n=1 Tax=Thioclava litoralis TaxID=3076557 RepID=A0ABZ1DXB9_9RHOB|nr:hypothetical protein RPE78_12245 [Thioclava sp. FTW29]